MVKPPARPLIRCAPVCLAAAAFVIGGVALPGVALPGAALAARGAALSARGPALAAPARLPDVPGVPAGVPDIAGLSPVTGLPSIVGLSPVTGLPSVEGLLPGIALPTPAWQHLVPLRPVRPPSATPAPVPGLGGAAQPGDPDGWFDHEEPDEPAPDEEPPDAPEPDEEDPAAEAPAAPDAPAPPVEPMRPTVGPPPATGAAPRPTPVSPSPRQSRTPTTTPSPADTRGLDELFPDRPSTDTPAAGAPHGSAAGGEPVGYARPLIYSGIAGMLISAIGIGVVLNRRRGW